MSTGHAQFERSLAHDVANRQFTGVWVVVHDLTLAVAFGQLRQHMDAESKDLCAVQYGFDRSMIIRAKVAQRSPFAITVDLGALVEKYFHRLAAEDFQRELVAHGIYILNRTPDDGALSGRPGRQGIQARRTHFGALQRAAPPHLVWLLGSRR